jgi:hypothetical protein
MASTMPSIGLEFEKAFRVRTYARRSQRLIAAKVQELPITLAAVAVP